MSDRRLILVVGVGRSGTSLLAGILGQLGMRIPQPEVRANRSNPRGFGEPRWVVDFHRRLMHDPDVNVHVFDGRPAAFDRAAATAQDADVRAELRAWLTRELDAAPVVVVKDPRTGWFLPLWTACASELGARTSTLTMLRHPVEVVLSARQSYGAWQSNVSRAAGWLNQMLQIEHATRGRSRAFVRYDELLADWGGTVRAAGAQIGLPELAGLDPGRHASIDAFVDPELHRQRGAWEALTLPPMLEEVMQEAWEALLLLSGPAEQHDPAHNRLDAARARYRRLYSASAQISQSTVIAARRRAPRTSPPPPSPSARLRAAIVRRIPEGPRRRLRRAVKARRRAAAQRRGGGTGRSGA